MLGWAFRVVMLRCPAVRASFGRNVLVVAIRMLTLMRLSLLNLMVSSVSRLNSRSRRVMRSMRNSWLLSI